MKKIGEITNFHIILKKEREKAGYTATHFAALLGIKQNTYSSYETGRAEPPYSVLIQISQTLNVSIDFLFGLSKDNSEKILAHNSIIQGANYGVANNTNSQLDCRNCAHITRLTDIISAMVANK